MKNLYVVWRDTNGAIVSSEVEVEGKINALSVKLAVLNDLDYYKRSDFDRIISWQEMEEFTWEEQEKYYNDYKNI